MSSKIIRAGDRNAAGASVWRPRERTSPYKTEPRASQPQAEAEPSRDFEARVQAAYQQGYAAGQAVGIQQASEPAAAALSRVAGDLASVGKRFRAEVEHDTVRLAIAIARRVLHRELSVDPEAITGLVMGAFKKLNLRETHRLRMCPADAAIVQEQRSRFNFPDGLEIIADSSLQRASAVFETSRGELDASADTQFAEIERGFADLVKRRSR